MPYFPVRKGRPYVQNNVAGSLAPLTSEYFQEFSRSQPVLLAKTPPIGHQWHSGPGGTIGVVIPRAADPQPTVGATGYAGDLPNRLLPVVKALPPWMRRR